jgi:broad specificity phosphatase PhoE
VVALVSHADVIKAALLGVLHLSLDEYHRFEISPASVSVVAQEGGYGRVLLMNGNGGELTSLLV